MGCSTEVGSAAPRKRRARGSSFLLRQTTVSVTRLRTSAFRKIEICVSEQSLFRRSAPYKSGQQHHEKDALIDVNPKV